MSSFDFIADIISHCCPINKRIVHVLKNLKCWPLLIELISTLQLKINYRTKGQLIIIGIFG